MMHISHRRELSTPSYKLVTSFKTVKSVKDLDVVVSSDLSRSEDDVATVNKANKVRGLVFTMLGPSNPEASSMFCKSLVYPSLECAAPIWNPYFYWKKIQGRACHLVLSQKRGETS